VTFPCESPLSSAGPKLSAPETETKRPANDLSAGAGFQLGAEAVGLPARKAISHHYLPACPKMHGKAEITYPGS